MEQNKELSTDKQCDIHDVISRYSDADIFKFTDGWWITTYCKNQKRFIKLIGSFKTKDEARAEIISLNGL